MLYTEISSKISSFFGGGSSSEEEPTTPPPPSENATEEPAADESPSSQPAPEDSEQGTINTIYYIEIHNYQLPVSHTYLSKLVM